LIRNHIALFRPTWPVPPSGPASPLVFPQQSISAGRRSVPLLNTTVPGGSKYPFDATARIYLKFDLNRHTPRIFAVQRGICLKL